MPDFYGSSAKIDDDDSGSAALLACTISLLIVSDLAG
jgi:hypothetical protein